MFKILWFSICCFNLKINLASNMVLDLATSTPRGSPHFLVLLHSCWPSFYASYFYDSFFYHPHCTCSSLCPRKLYPLLALLTLLSFSSVRFSRSVVSDSLQPHELQHTRPPCPSPTPGVHSDSRPSSQWCHSAISSSVVPSSSCPQSLPASESFPMSQLFTWGGQSTGVSALASFLPKNTQDWSPLEWTGWISLRSKGLSRVFSNTTVQKHQFFSTPLSFLHSPTLTSIYDHWKNHSLD